MFARKEFNNFEKYNHHQQESNFFFIILYWSSWQKFISASLRSPVIFQLYNYEQLWCTSYTIMNNCDVPVLQSWKTVMCRLYNYKQLWCAGCTIMINCDVPVVQLWITVMCRLYNYEQLWCSSCTSLTILIFLGTRNKLVIRKENVTTKIIWLMKINLEGWITLQTNCKQLKSCNLMVFFLMF